MEINEIEKQITEDALNHYWHYVMDMLAKNSLGDIQRANLELDKKRLNELLERFRHPCT
jgi:1,2-phenylacetyl-CoA epoxidase catalytic subunit